MRLAIRIFVFIAWFIPSLVIGQSNSLNIQGGVTDICLTNDQFFVSSNQGNVYQFNLKNKKRIHTIKVPQIKDFAGDNISPRIHSIDYNSSNNTLLIISQGLRGFTNAFIYKNGKLINIIDHTKRLNIKSARFINEEEILLSTLSNEIISFNINNKSINWQHQISYSRFSDIAIINNDKTAIIADESGKLKLVDLNTLQSITNNLKSHLDNIYDLDANDDVIISGGKDQKVMVNYLSHSQHYQIKSDFIVYCVALSSKGDKACFSSGEEAEIKVFTTVNGKIIKTIKSRDHGITKLLFVDSNLIIAGYEDGKIVFWTLN